MHKFWREENVQKTKFEAAEMIIDPWNQQTSSSYINDNSPSFYLDCPSHYSREPSIDTDHLLHYWW